MEVVSHNHDDCAGVELNRGGWVHCGAGRGRFRQSIDPTKAKAIVLRKYALDYYGIWKRLRGRNGVISANIMMGCCRLEDGMDGGVFIHYGKTCLQQKQQS